MVIKRKDIYRGDRQRDQSTCTCIKKELEYTHIM